ncbi:hypothetical protein ACPPVW_06745 [Leifsonia sp. McL0607]|uniref:hypothetical protein n=1 Tax=Leifsonia sp. McL0607 TaxID=3415672 RepID=UPI003CF5CB63
MSGRPVNGDGGAWGRNRVLLSDASFAVGSVCFALAALPSIAVAIGAIATNVVFVTGSIFFTAGAGLALGLPNRSSSLIQFVGTLFFNVSTSLALAAAVPAGAAGGTGWRPDVYGSICFLVSSVLAVVALARQRADRARWSSEAARSARWSSEAARSARWSSEAARSDAATPAPRGGAQEEREAILRPQRRGSLRPRAEPATEDSVAAWLNLTGSVLFGVAAIGAFELPGTDALLSPFWSGVGTVGGALCFLAAAVLGLVPTARARPERQRAATSSK